MTRRAVVLLSGGMDSMVCAAIARELGFGVLALTIDYNQRHRVELAAAKRIAGLLASLPLTSLLAMIWLWRDTGDPQRVGDLALGAFWFVLPSLPLFLILPLLLRSEWGFWPAILASCAVTLVLYAGMFALSDRLGIRF